MNIVTIGTDKSLVGGLALGDAVERHRRYGAFVSRLDIIVYTNRRDGLSTFTISERVTGHPTNSIAKWKFPFDVLQIFCTLHATHPVDVVVCQDPFVPGVIGWWLKRRYGVKLQINFHGDFFGNPLWLAEKKIHRLYALLMQFTIWQADAIRAASDGIRQKLVQRGIAPEKIFVISTPVDLTPFEAVSARLSGPPVILTVGRIVEAKDYPTLLKTARLVHNRLPAVEWWIAGTGPLLDQLKSESADQAYVKWLGYVDHKDLPALYEKASVVCLTSTNESFGKVLVEANAAGRPVVATATTGAKAIIDGGINGFVVPIGDALALADKLVEVLVHPELARTLGEQGRALMRERFSHNTEKIVALWRQLAGK